MNRTETVSVLVGVGLAGTISGIVGMSFGGALVRHVDRKTMKRLQTHNQLMGELFDWVTECHIIGTAEEMQEYTERVKFINLTIRAGNKESQ